MPITSTAVVPDITAKPKAKNKNPFKCDPGMYYVKVVDVDEAQPTAKTEEYGPSWVWKFVVLDANMNVILAETEEGVKFPHVLVQFTSDKLGINFNTKEPARARKFLEGLLQEKLPTGASAQELVNKALSTHSIAHALITQDPKKPEYMTIGTMLPVTDEEVRTRIEEAVQAATPQSEEIPF